jgi:hypothetical protein
LGDRLITVFELSRCSDLQIRGISEEMMGKVAEEAREVARGLPFGEVVNTGALRRKAAIAALAILLAAGFGAWRSDLLVLWFQRSVLMGSQRWPRSTHLTLLHPPEIVVARGDPLTLTAQADQAFTVPGQVVFRLAFQTAGEVEETVDASPDGQGFFRKKIDAVTEPFHFFVYGNDDRTSECRVRLVEPPQLADVNFQILPPSYISKTPIPVPPGSGTLNIPLGSSLRFSARCTKDLVSAKILLDGAALTDGVISSVPVKEAPRPRPTAQLAGVNFTGFATARAIVPCRIEAHDDYGLRYIQLEWTVTTTKSDPVLGQVHTYDTENGQIVTKGVFQGTLDLEGVGKAQEGPAGAKFKTGDVLRLRAIISDNLPPPAGPNVTPSNPLTLKLVDESEILDALNEMQRGLQDQIRQTSLIQGEAHEKILAAVDAKELAPARQRIHESSNHQLQVGDRLSTIRARFEEILERMHNNRVGTDQERGKIDKKVIQPLTGVLQGPVKELPPLLQAAFRKDDKASLPNDLKGIAMLQLEVQTRLDAILAEIVKIEGHKEIQRKMNDIIRSTESAKDAVREEIQKGQGGAEGKKP